MSTVQFLTGFSEVSNFSLMLTVPPLIKNVCKNKVVETVYVSWGGVVCTQEGGGGGG